jgi:hypothetical protein
MDKDKFITPVYTLIGMAGFTLRIMQLSSLFASTSQARKLNQELAIRSSTQKLR